MLYNVNPHSIFSFIWFYFLYNVRNAMWSWDLNINHLIEFTFIRINLYYDASKSNQSSNLHTCFCEQRSAIVEKCSRDMTASDYIYKSWSTSSHNEHIKRKEKKSTMSPNGIPLTRDDKGRRNMCLEKNSP